MIICECGHSIDIHDLTGCNFPRPYAPNDCACELSPEAVEARYERDALRKQLEIALAELDYLEPRTDEYVKASIIKTLEEINRIGGMNVQR